MRRPYCEQYCYFVTIFWIMLRSVMAKAGDVFITGYIQPVRYVNEAGLTQYYCDGGLVCNFPLHCFDGWLHLHIFHNPFQTF